MRSNASASQWRAILAAVGYYPWPGDDDDPLLFVTSGMVAGPKAIWFNAGGVAAIEVSLLVEYLCDKGIDAAALNQAVLDVLG